MSRPDDATGFNRAPNRYTAAGRETIDSIRDALGDKGFAAFCRGNAMKYVSRAGRKGDYWEDMAKAWWYAWMFLHVRGEAEDPRSGREGFVPYTWRGEPVKHNCRNCWTCRFNEFEDGEGWCRLTDSNMSDLREIWAQAFLWDDRDMPPHDADGCPGWAPKSGGDR